MWLAMLCGRLGSNINKLDPAYSGGGTSSVPVAVVVAIAALLGTIAVAHWTVRLPRPTRTSAGSSRRITGCSSGSRYGLTQFDRAPGTEKRDGSAKRSDTARGRDEPCAALCSPQETLRLRDSTFHADAASG
jgi:hypothetical protein